MTIELLWIFRGGETSSAFLWWWKCTCENTVDTHNLDSRLMHYVDN